VPWLGLRKNMPAELFESDLAGIRGHQTPLALHTGRPDKR